jgi:hypothetical protein
MLTAMLAVENTLVRTMISGQSMKGRTTMKKREENLSDGLARKRPWKV